ncbi:MAG: hypothetical protein M1819_004092 [Sarea resinae]|nr:MAG: hypothetical protein M1819_004092 [Sarea resinae]
MLKGITLISSKVPWVFSIILESVCVLPQLLLLRQTTVPTVIDSFYLLTLGSYRAFYICNWIVRLASKEHYWDSIAVIFGIIQTAFYVDFAWVYWSRQRVKLRAGGVVDSDDLSRGWLISRILGHKHNELEDEETTHALDEDDEDDESGRRAASRRTTSSSGRWGARGISVSADHGLPDTPSRGHVHPGDVKARLALDSPADELGDILEGDEDEGLGPNISPAFAQETGVTSGEEWRDGSGK